jgi:molecular chaperone GrpE
MSSDPVSNPSPGPQVPGAARDAADAGAAPGARAPADPGSPARSAEETGAGAHAARAAQGPEAGSSEQPEASVEAQPEAGDEPETPREITDGAEDAVDALAALLERAEKADEYLLLAQRTKADFENYRKRSLRDAAAAQERGVAKLAKELLPALDNLDRALSAAQAAAAAAGEGDEVHGQLLSGIQLVHADVLSALQRAGIEGFSPQGQPFDPNIHEAVAQAPIAGAEPGSVAEVYQRGYRLGETVLRPARVLVAA